jgi:hypothetical protein
MTATTTRTVNDKTVNLNGAVRGSIRFERTARGDHAVTLTQAFDGRSLTITGELADLVVLKALLGSYISDCQEAGASDEVPDGTATQSFIAEPQFKAAFDAQRAHIANCKTCTAEGRCQTRAELGDLLTAEGELIQDAQERGHLKGIEIVESIERGDAVEAWYRVYTDGVLIGRRRTTLTVDRRPWMSAGLDTAVVSDGESVTAVIASSIRVINRASL